MKLRLLAFGVVIALVVLLGYWLVPSMAGARQAVGPRRIPKAPISEPTAQDKLNQELRRPTPPAPPRPNPIKDLEIPCTPTGNGVKCKGRF